MADLAEAFGWGTLSASANLIGCALGLIWPGIPIRLRAVLMGFGAGSLLFGITLSLFGDEIFNLDQYGLGSLFAMIFAALLGGLAFPLLNYVIEERGGWVRHLSKRKKRFQEWKDKRLVPMMYKILRKQAGYSNLGPVQSLHFELEKELADEFAKIEDIEIRRLQRFSRADVQLDTVLKNNDSLRDSNNEDESDQEEGNEELQEPVESWLTLLVLWLGLFLGSIPESLLLGISTTSQSGIDYALVIAFFLANFPEALSSSINMLENGMSRFVICIMWVILVVIAGMMTFIGASLQEPSDADPDGAYYIGAGIFQGAAAGAMLMIVADRMMPEAFLAGESLSGLAVLFGFLVGLFLELWSLG